ncbi:MAG: SIR2 family protein [Flavobacteriaceae bacterium]
MKGELSSVFGIKKVFVIGAGFSFPAGMPLTNGLLKLIHKKASEKDYYDSKGKVKMGQAEVLLSKLQYYYPMLNITHEKISNGEINEINIEEFLSFIAAESTFLSSGEKFNEHGSKFLAFMKQWLGEIIHEEQFNIFNQIPEFYKSFVNQINDSLVITFNWDTLLENLFNKQNIKYRNQLNVDDSDFDNRKKSIPLLKLHGSIDWFRSTKENKSNKDEFESLGYGFGNIHRCVGSLKHQYAKYNSPWIIIPNFDKLNQLKDYGELWETPERYFNDNLEIIFIGFSLRKDDFHTRAFMYPKLVNGSKNGQYRVKVIDFAENTLKEQEIKNRFLGIENCQFWFKGFNKESLKFIFN